MIITYPAPAELEPSRNYRLFVNDAEVFVYDTQVQLDGMDILRHIDHPYMSSFAYFDTDEAVIRVRIEPLFTGIDTVTVTPRSRYVCPLHDGRSVTFEMKAPDTLNVEVNSLANRALMIFANPPQTDIPSPDDQDVIYFGPGLHQIPFEDDSQIRIPTGTTLYIAGGAVVQGVITAQDADHIRIRGRGILDGGHSVAYWADFHESYVGIKQQKERQSGVSLRACRDVDIRGIHIVDAAAWSLAIFDCEDVTVDGIRIIGSYANNDGIDVCNTSHVQVRNCFLRNSDDGFVVKLLDGSPIQSMQDVHFSHSVIRADRASALEIGHECCGKEIFNISFTDIDILDQVEETYGYHAIDITNVDDADVHDILYEDIRVDRCCRLFGARIRPSVFGHANQRGGVHHITLRNIRCDGNETIFICGNDAGHRVEDVTMENILIRGRYLTDLTGLYHNNCIDRIRLVCPDGSETFARIYPTAQCRPLDIRPMTNISLGADRAPLMLSNPDWMTLPGGVSDFSGIPFHLSSHGYNPKGEGSFKRAAIPNTRRRADYEPVLAVGERANWIYFLHTAAMDTSPIGSIIARYEILYDDDTRATIPVRLGNDISTLYQWSLAGWQYVHHSLRLYVMPWENPRPDKIIRSISLKDGDIPETALLMGITLA